MVYTVDPNTSESLQCEICKKSIDVPKSGEQAIKAPPPAPERRSNFFRERDSQEQPIAPPQAANTDSSNTSSGEQPVVTPPLPNAAQPSGGAPVAKAITNAAPQANPMAPVAAAVPITPNPTPTPQAVATPSTPTPSASAVPPTAPATQPSSAPMAQVIPPHLQDGKPPEKETPAEQPRKTAATRASKRQAKTMFYAGMALCLLLLVGSIGAFVVVMRPELVMPSGGSQGSGGGLAEGVITMRGGDRMSGWANAEAATLKLDGVSVRIDRVEIGDVRVKDGANTVQVANGPFLQVRVEVKNHKRGVVDYRTWWNQTFSGGDSIPMATLKDNAGREYPMATLDGAKSVQGTITVASIEKGKSITDTIIFDIPSGQNPAGAAYLQLELPAAAHSGFGNHRFQIPGTMINQ